MAVVYSTRLVQAHNLSGDTTYTVPDGFLAIIRDVDWFCAAPIDDGSQGYMYGPAGQSIDWFNVDMDTTVVHQWRGRQVLYEGETLTFHSDLAADVTASGYLLTLP